MRQPQQWNGIWTIALIGCLTQAVWLLVTQPVRADTNLEATESDALSTIPAD
ncbi:hypothetical protein [Gloeocapsopsis sp. IPPAS B-1203]|uniref:hypothetical protein n=1 Tax=Gloeocapsopsis sp. IPPAS B-1203 TaxID=2049454 RepID=UPI0025A2B922|nr:hypothetical protein [Gloeocapsopsis sp. IPPAS B-1203]